MEFVTSCPGERSQKAPAPPGRGAAVRPRRRPCRALTPLARPQAPHEQRPVRHAERGARRRGGITGERAARRRARRVQVHVGAGRGHRRVGALRQLHLEAAGGGGVGGGGEAGGAGSGGAGSHRHAPLVHARWRVCKTGSHLDG